MDILFYIDYKIKENQLYKIEMKFYFQIAKKRVN
jgi:hypothetical protein